MLGGRPDHSKPPVTYVVAHAMMLQIAKPHSDDKPRRLLLFISIGRGAFSPHSQIPSYSFIANQASGPNLESRVSIPSLFGAPYVRETRPS